MKVLRAVLATPLLSGALGAVGMSGVFGVFGASDVVGVVGGLGVLAPGVEGVPIVGAEWLLGTLGALIGSR